MNTFLQVQNGQAPSVLVKISSANENLAKKNREILIRLIDVFRYCAERGLALRGHRDDGIPSIDEDDYVNLGNFKAAVASHAKHDPLLREHLDGAANKSYASYLSKYAQADLTAILLDHLQAEILREVRDQTGSFMYAISADEVTDSSNTEQLAIVLRSVGKHGEVRERLLQYNDMDSVTGEAVAQSLIECLEQHGLDIMDCRGQTYDGAGNMSGKFKGCQKRISNKQPLAVYHHCSSHRLNLALNATSQVTEFRVMLENVKRLGIFFGYSPKRCNVLRMVLEKAEPPIIKTKVCLLVIILRIYTSVNR